MLEANPQGVIHFPTIGMAQFNKRRGPIPVEYGGGNRYRVIWAPSRKILTTERDGVSRVRGVYAAIRGENGNFVAPVVPLKERMSPDLKPGEVWVLEQWLAPRALYDGTSDQYYRDPRVDMLATYGPYPANGDYMLCENTRIIGMPTVEHIEKLILMVEDAMFNQRAVDNAIAIERGIEREAREKTTLRKDIIDNRRLIGSGEPYAARGGSRGSKTRRPMRYTTRDVGIAPGQTGALKRPNAPLYRIPLTA